MRHYLLRVLAGLLVLAVPALAQIERPTVPAALDAIEGAGARADLGHGLESVPAVLPIGGVLAPAPITLAPTAADAPVSAALAAPAPAPAQAAAAPAESAKPVSSALGSARTAASPDAAPDKSAAATFDGAALPAPANVDAPVAFRSRIEERGVYLIRVDPSSKDDTFGLRLGSSLEKTDLRSALQSRGESLRGGRLALTGVEMGSEKTQRGVVAGLLAELGLKADDVRVEILSVPRPWSSGFWRALRDRVIYFLPSPARDYQAPLLSEIKDGIKTTLILEGPNAYYLWKVMPMPDVAIVLSVHAGLLAGYTMFQRGMSNWILRSKTSVGMFSKGLLTSVPFIFNYNVLGNFSAMASFLHANGLGVVLHRLPSDAAHFFVTLSLTTTLQTIFYTEVVNSRFRGWSSNPTLPEDAAAARSWVQWLLVPWLWLDSVFLTQASTASTVLFRAGPFVLTGGHIALVALTAAGCFVASRRGLLDATFGWYKRHFGAAPQPK